MSIISLEDIKIIKKDGTLESFNIDKVIKAIKKSSERVLNKLTDKQIEDICFKVKSEVLNEGKNIDISEMHNIVETILSSVNEDVAKSYRDYRNYKQDFVHMLDKVYQESQRIMYLGDKSNANADSSLVSTQRSLIFNELSTELYKKFFLSKEELQAIKDGYIYCHDISSRLLTTNCCLFDVASVLKNGFQMGNIWYNEPKTLDVAFDVMSDMIVSVAAQQYGGISVSNIQSVLKPYAEKSYKLYYDKYISLGLTEDKAKKQAWSDLKDECRQGVQAWEMKWNTVGSSRGDFPFISISFGLGTSKIEQMINKTFLEVRMNGQGKKGFRKPVLFPKLIFLYDENLHGEGKELEDVFNCAVECSKKTMYPDYVSLSGSNYVSQIYKKYGKTITPMGCRSFLSPYYKNGGLESADENDEPVYEGRGNVGVISLNLPMIYMKSKQEKKDFHQVLDYYLEMIRKLHLKTIDFLGEKKASCNPLMYTQGGFYGGYLNPNDKIKPILKSFTTSFGITALNELQRLYNKKSITEDGQFALETMKYIADKVEQFKKEDGVLHSCYGSPAESLCGKQVEQFRLKYGIIENVSDREYMSNSFHCHVSEDITPIEKQDLEGRFIDLCKGGQIYFNRFNCDYNTEAFKILIRRAMKKGFYFGTNLNLSYCEDCGHQELDMDVCPKCGSHNVTQINRVCGYLGYSRINEDTRFNKAKLAETKDRKSY